MTRAVPSRDRISAELTLYEHVKAELLDTAPDIDDETLLDTLEGATNLHDILASLIRSALLDELYVDALRSRIGTMKERLQRLEARALTKRDLTLKALSAASIPKLVADDFTAFVRAGPPGLEVIDEHKIPERFWKVQAPKLDRQALLAALRADEAVQGARLSPPQYQLSVRIK